jgi:hypothetical protein
MRVFSALLIVVVLVLLGFGGQAYAQTCIGTACQTTCANGQTTSITGTVYAPNGTDPLPNVTVYIPTTSVDPFKPGVSCPISGSPPSGSPLVGTITNVNGGFTLVDVPVGSNIPLVIVSGRWRRQLTIPSTTACVNTVMPASFAAMPQNQTQGDIPKIAIATGAVDQVECVLLKVGINDSEFTDPTGTGRINFYLGSGTNGNLSAAGASIDAATPTQASLMENASTLNQYDVLMLPCQGTPIGDVVAGTLGTQELANFINFANMGGRVYSSHYSYVWMQGNGVFDGVATWSPGIASITSGTATVNTSFTAGQTLSQWLSLPVIDAATSPGQMALDTLRVDTTGVIAPTQSWLSLNNAQYNNPTMQFVFDTPIAPSGQTINQCGRVLFNEYHVEGGSSSPSTSFPSECPAGAMTPQEKLLEYMLFELTDEGGQPSLAPTSQDFGSEAVGFPSATETFTWTNNSSFVSQVSAATIIGDSDFAVTSNNCGSVAGGASCTITVVFTPSALGPGAATLTVTSGGGNSLTSSLTGIGTPGYSLSGSSLSFGSLDVGATASQILTLTSLASGPLPIPPFVTTGQYAVSTAACGNQIAAMGNCSVKVTFLPTVIGPLNGTLGVSSTSLLYNGLTATLTGNGIDFTIALSPTSGSVVAGDSVSTTATLTPLAGFAAPLALTCLVSGANASTCGLTTAAVTPTTVTTDVVSMTTTSQYVVIGYGGFGGRGYLWLVALGSGLLLWRRRRSAGVVLRAGLMMVLLAAVGVSMTGCSGKLPAQNSVYTGPGTYNITVSATDGFLVHSATYTLTVNAK